MRPLSEQQQRLLRHPVGYTVRGRVRVLGPDGTWHDLTDFLGRDFLDGVDVDEGVDSPVGQATVRLMREVRGLSLAPLMTSSRANNLGGSYAPLLDPNRLFRVEVALGPPRALATSPAWLPLFFGRIDSVDSGNPDTITFTGRDMAGVLQDVWTGEEKTYGSDVGVPLETVCQAILTDAQLGTDFALYTPVASEQALGKYKQDFEPTMDALAKLAAGRGWEVRWKLRPDTGDWGLWLWSPYREATAPVWTYTAADYRYLGELRVGLEDIRTAVEVVYPDASDLDDAGQPKRKTVRRESPTALARYGYLNAAGTRLHRLMRVTEGATTNIRSATEAGRLADAGLSDLSTTDMGASVEVALHPGLELGDLVALAPNGINFSAEQRLAVRQVTHSLTATSGRTTLRLLGKPALGPHVWLSMEARPGIAPGSPFTGPAAPSGLTVTNSVTGAVLLFTEPNLTSGGPPAKEYELHVYDSPGAALSKDTLRSVSSSTSFDLTGLTAGATLYARVRSRDRKGNVGPASAEVALSPRYVEPRMIQQRVTFGALPLNGSMEAWNHPSTPPDAWTAAPASAWPDIINSISMPYSGQRAVSFSPGAAELQAQAFTCAPSDLFVVTSYARAASGTATGTMRIRFLKEDFSTSSTVDVPISVSTVYVPVVKPVAADVNARYCLLSFVRTSSDTGTLYVDGVDALRTVAFSDWRVVDPVGESGAYGVFQTGWDHDSPSVTFAAAYRSSPLGRVELRGEIVASGTPATGIFRLPYAPFRAVHWRVLTNSGSATLTVGVDGWLSISSAAGGLRVSLNSLYYDLT